MNSRVQQVVHRQKYYLFPSLCFKFPFLFPLSGMIFRKKCTEGPIATAKATVPTPTGPPKKNPIIKTVISIELRTSRMLFPVFLLNPSMRLSLGPAPRFALMYSPDPIPMRMTPHANNYGKSNDLVHPSKSQGNMVFNSHMEYIPGTHSQIRLEKKDNTYSKNEETYHDLKVCTGITVVEMEFFHAGIHHNEYKRVSPEGADHSLLYVCTTK